jgi:hypothetical protein
LEGELLGLKDGPTEGLVMGVVGGEDAEGLVVGVVDGELLELKDGPTEVLVVGVVVG